jgi:hypothetical protein
MATYDTLQVDIGSAPNDNQGDPLRQAFDKINQRFQELRIFVSNRGVWQPGTTYTADPNRDWVIVDGVGYLATTNHTSGATFAADLAAGKWVDADSVKLRADLASTTSGNGAELVGFKQAGAGAVDRTLQQHAAQFVWVFDFVPEAERAAIFAGTSTWDAIPAIRAAATHANATGLPLRMNPGTYFCSSAGDIDLRVDLDATGAVFKMGAGSATSAVFHVVGNELQDITSSVTLSQITKGITVVPSLAAYTNGFLKIESNTPNVKRNTTDTVVLTKSECGYLSKRGSLATEIRHDYSGGAITKVSFRKDEKTRITIKGGALDVNGLHDSKFVLVKRNAVTVKNWSVYDSTNANRIDRAMLFQAFECANPVFEDFDGDAMLQSQAGVIYSYLFNLGYVYNTRFSRCHVMGGRGAWAANNVNGYHITDSSFDRFDTHYDSYDVSVSNSSFYYSVIYGCGGGYMRITNCTKMVKNTISILNNTSWSGQIISQRGDYGGEWDGDILVSQINVQVASNFQPSTDRPICAFSFGASGDFGAGRSLRVAKTISIRDMIVDVPGTLTSTGNFGLVAAYFNGGLTHSGGTPGTIPPIRLSVQNVVFNKDGISGYANNFEQSASYTASLDSSEPAMRLVSGQLSTSNGTRGNFAVDLQTSVNSNAATAKTQVAAGFASGVLSGSENRASGDYSAIFGGQLGDTKGRNHSWAFSGSARGLGKNQWSGMVVRAETTGSTPVAMTTDTQAGGLKNQFILSNSSAVAFTAKVVARNTDGGALAIKGWEIKGLARNQGGMVIIGTPTVTVLGDTNATALSVTVGTDNTNRALVLNAVGEAGRTHAWTAVIDSAEIVF